MCHLGCRDQKAAMNMPRQRLDMFRQQAAVRTPRCWHLLYVIPQELGQKPSDSYPEDLQPSQLWAGFNS